MHGMKARLRTAVVAAAACAAFAAGTGGAGVARADSAPPSPAWQLSAADRLLAYAAGLAGEPGAAPVAATDALLNQTEILFAQLPGLSGTPGVDLGGTVAYLEQALGQAA